VACLDFCAETAARFGHAWEEIRHTIEAEVNDLLELFILANARFEEALKMIIDIAIEKMGDRFLIGPAVQRAAKDMPSVLRPVVTRQMVEFGQTIVTGQIDVDQANLESNNLLLYQIIFNAILRATNTVGAQTQFELLIEPIKKDVEQVLATFIREVAQLKSQTA